MSNQTKNNRTIKTEIGVRKAIAHLKQLHGDKRFMCPSKTDGVVACEFKPSVRIVARSPTNVVMQSKALVVEKNGIDRVTMQTEFDSDLEAGAEVQWAWQPSPSFS